MIAPTKVIDICRACANRGWLPDVIELTDEFFEECKPFVEQAIKEKLDLTSSMIAKFSKSQGIKSVGKSRVVDHDNLILLGLTIRRAPQIRAGYFQGKKTFWEAFE